MPGESDLPQDIRRLARLQAITISDTRWNHDVSILISRLQEISGRYLIYEKIKRNGLKLFIVAFGLLITLLFIFFSETKLNAIDQLKKLSVDLSADSSPEDIGTAIKSILRFSAGTNLKPMELNFAVSKLKTILKTEDRQLRSVRRAALEAIREIRNGDIEQDFLDGSLEAADLVSVLLANTSLRNVSFKKLFLIQTDFRGANLSGSNFSNSFIRNVKFHDAKLENAVLANADWFNALGISENQLRSVKNPLPCPKVSGRFSPNAFHEYLSHN